MLSFLNILPDFSYNKPHANTKLLYVHRKLADRDLYWVNNRNTIAEDVEATFRIAGKLPEIWHAETGKSEPASYTIADGVTKVPLHLQPNDAVFVIFKGKAVNASVTLPGRARCAC